MPTLADYKAPYPEPDSEFKRCVIYLDPKDNDDELQHLKVELLPGKTMSCDEDDKYVIQGEIEERTVDGWGYDYYVVSFGSVIDKETREVAEPEGSNAVFVPIDSTGPTLRYNSKLPIVVYVPHDAEVRYRIWYDEVTRAKAQEGSVGQDGNGDTLSPAEAGNGRAREVAVGAYPTEEDGVYPGESRNAVPSAGEYSSSAANPSRDAADYPIPQARATALSSQEANSETISPNRKRGSGSSPTLPTGSSAPVLRNDETSATRSRAAPSGISGSEMSPTRSRAVPLSNDERSAPRDREADTSKNKGGRPSLITPLRSRGSTSPSKASKSPSRARGTTSPSKASKAEEAARRNSRYQDEL